MLTEKEKKEKAKLNKKVYALYLKKRPTSIELASLPNKDAIPTHAKNGTLGLRSAKVILAWLEAYKP